MAQRLTYFASIGALAAQYGLRSTCSFDEGASAAPDGGDACTAAASAPPRRVSDRLLYPRWRAAAVASTKPVTPADNQEAVATEHPVRVVEVTTATLPHSPCLAEATTTDGHPVQYLRFVSRTGVDGVIPAVKGDSLPPAAVLLMLPQLWSACQQWSDARKLLQAMLAHVSQHDGVVQWSAPEEYYLMGVPLSGADCGQPSGHLVERLLESMDRVLTLEAFDESFWTTQQVVLKRDAEFLKTMAAQIVGGTGFGSFVGVLASDTTIPQLEETLSRTCLVANANARMAQQQQSNSSEAISSSDTGGACKNGLLDVAALIVNEWWAEKMQGRVASLSPATSGRDNSMVLLPLPYVGAKWADSARFAIVLEHLSRAMEVPLRVTATPRALCFTAFHDESAAVVAAQVGSLLRGLRDSLVPQSLLDALQVWVNSYNGTESVAGASVSQKTDARVIALFADLPTPPPIVPSVAEMAEFASSLDLTKAIILAHSRISHLKDLQEGGAGASSSSSFSESFSEEEPTAELSEVACSTEEPRSLEYETSEVPAGTSSAIVEPPENEALLFPGVVIDAATVADMPEKLLQLLQQGCVGEPLQINLSGQPLIRERVPPGVLAPRAVALPAMAGGEKDTAVQIDGAPEAPVELRVFATLPTLQANADLSPAHKAAVRLMLARLIIAAAKKARLNFALPHLTQLDAFTVGRFANRSSAGRRNRIVFELHGQSNTIDFAVRSVLQDLDNLSALPEAELETARMEALAQLTTITGPGDNEDDFTLADVLSVDGARAGTVRRELQNLSIEEFRRLCARNPAGGCALFNDAMFEFEFRGYPSAALEMINLIRTRARWTTRRFSPEQLDALAGFHVADLVQLGRELAPEDRRLACVANYKSPRIKLVLAGKLPAEGREFTQETIRLLQHCFHSLVAKVAKDVKVEAMRFWDTIFFVLSGTRTSLDKMDDALSKLDGVSLASMISAASSTMESIQAYMITPETMKTARLADKLKWGMLNESLRLGFCSEESELSDGWTICDPDLSKQFGNRVPIVVDEAPPYIRNLI